MATKTVAGEERFMRRALTLARRGLGRTAPNPPVGAVAVRGGRIVGEGWHRAFGAPHAEAHLIERAGAACRGADLYVTLEPCDHHGKTPPCSQAIIAAGFRRVCYAVADPHPVTAGRGPRRLRRAGIEVAGGLLEEEGRWLLAPYLKHVATGLPLVTAKWAMSLDGRIATRTGDARWISSETARQRTRGLRREFDAILIGRGTATADDPELLCPTRGVRSPLRVVLDADLALSPDSRLVATTGSAPLLVCTARRPRDPRQHAARARLLGDRGVTLALVRHRQGRLDLGQVLAHLGEHGIQHLLVEGGMEVHGSFFDAALVDRVDVIIAPRIIGGRTAPAPIGGTGPARLAETLAASPRTLQRLGPDLRLLAALTPHGHGH